MTCQKRARLPGIPPDLTVTTPNKDKFEDNLITDTGYCRFLGTNYKNNFSWETHLQSGKKAILPAIRRQLGALYKLRKTLPVKAKLQLVNSLIVSKLSYAISIWGNTTENYTRKAQVCLNQAARFVLDCKRTTSKSTLMRGCNWLEVEEMVEYYSCIQLWKVIHWKVTEYMRRKIRVNDDYSATTQDPRLLTNSKHLEMENHWKMESTVRRIEESNSG